MLNIFQRLGTIDGFMKGAGLMASIGLGLKIMAAGDTTTGAGIISSALASSTILTGGAKPPAQ